GNDVHWHAFAIHTPRRKLRHSSLARDHEDFVAGRRRNGMIRTNATGSGWNGVQASKPFIVAMNAFDRRQGAVAIVLVTRISALAGHDRVGNLRVNTVVECTVPEKILIAAHELEQHGQSPFSAEALIVASWQKFPRTFGLKGYADQHPDSNKVLSCIMG